VIEFDVTLMRGGTSKGVFLSLDALPTDRHARDQFALRLMGSPDPMQVDGLGGTHSSTSKIVAVRTATTGTTARLEYLFAQVGVDQSVVDWSGNCGNLTSAVGPYAIYEGLLATSSPVTEVVMRNLNTDRLITAHVPVEGDAPQLVGDFANAGVPGTGAPIRLDWHDPGGTVTGEVLPTGVPVEEVRTSWGTIRVSIVDVSGPYVFVDAAAFGLSATEDSVQLDADRQLVARLAELRALCAERIGLTSAATADTLFPAIPRVCVVGAPRDYVTATGDAVRANDYDVAAKALSMGRIHHAFPGTGLLCLAAAYNINGTIPASFRRSGSAQVRIGHNKGVAPAAAQVVLDGTRVRVVSASSFRTARRLLKGTAYVDLR
jgi:2-methylaconitate cis-trans-isomerase PrpF